MALREIAPGSGVGGRLRRTALAALPWTCPLVVLLVVFYKLDMPVIRSDGLAYFCWLRTLLQDGNMSLTNEYALLEGVNVYQLFIVPRTGNVGTAFPFGSAILWSPFYGLGLWVGRTSWYVRKIAPLVDQAAYLHFQGTDFLASLSMTLGTNVMAVASVYLALDVARRRVSTAVASLASVAMFLGTPMVYYSTIEPTMSHIPATFCLSLLYWLLFRFGAYESRTERERPGIWLAIGVVLGLATTVRWQLVLTGVSLGLVLLYQRRWRSLAALCGGAAALAWTVPWSWNQMFGEPFVTPANLGDPSSFLVGPANLVKVWFSSRHGLLSWSPAVGFSVLGIALAARRHPQEAFHYGTALLLQSLISASVIDWWAGWSFGMRRMVELYPLYVLGLALFVDSVTLPGALRGRPSTFPSLLSWLSATVVAAAVGWNLFLLVTYASVSIDQGCGTLGDAVAFVARHGFLEAAHTIKGRFDAWYGFQAWRAPPPWR